MSKLHYCESFTMPSTQTVNVPHLGGITAAYQSSRSVDKSKPTLVLVNSFTTSSELYADALKNRDLTNVMNLVAIELLGHGQTVAHETENWTYWDTAIMNLQVMEALGIDQAFVLGTSQGGWVTVRMALLRPDKVGLKIPCHVLGRWRLMNMTRSSVSFP
jgi:pimeloyl-ACP methyl ester carboxylesterase